MSLRKSCAQIASVEEDGVEMFWPNEKVQKYCKEIKEQRGAHRNGKLRCSTIQTLLDRKAKSLRDVNNVTVDMEAVEHGVQDLAEMRSDYVDSFYSNFTAQQMAYPKKQFSNCPTLCYPLRMSWSFWAFIVSALHQLLFNTEAMSMSLLGCTATFFCSEKMLDLRCTYQTSAIFIGLIFPMVFLIGQTYLRREKAIERLASIKANAIQLVLKLVVHPDNANIASALMVIETTCALFTEIASFLPQDSEHSGLRVCSIYGRFAALQKERECAMLTRFMLVEFEKLRTQRDYRTPWKLNYFCFLCGTFAPVGMAPLFASMGCADRFPTREKVDPSQTCGYGTPGAYLTAFFFAVVMSSLLSIVKAMEDPFGLNGPDDVISTFSFERNALLHLIEDHHPGSLEKHKSLIMSATRSSFCGGTTMIEEIHKEGDAKKMQAQRQSLTRLQGQVDDDSDDGEGGGEGAELT